MHLNSEIIGRDNSSPTPKIKIQNGDTKQSQAFYQSQTDKEKEDPERPIHKKASPERIEKNQKLISFDLRILGINASKSTPDERRPKET